MSPSPHDEFKMDFCILTELMCEYSSCANCTIADNMREEEELIRFDDIESERYREEL